MTDNVNHPRHYTQAAAQLEPIDVLRYAPFCIGNCLKYVIRAGYKGDALEDCRKACLYFKWASENSIQTEEFLLNYATLLVKFDRLSGLRTDPKGFMEDLMLLIDNQVAMLEIVCKQN